MIRVSNIKWDDVNHYEDPPKNLPVSDTLDCDMNEDAIHDELHNKWGVIAVSFDAVEA